MEIMMYGLMLISITSVVILSFWTRFRFRLPLLITSYVVASLMALFSVFALMGNAVPVNIVSFVLHSDVTQGKVLWYTYKENEYILVLLHTDVSPFPIYVRLPWVMETAEKLDEGARKKAKAEREGTGSGESTLLSPFGGPYKSKSGVKYETIPQYYPIPKPQP